ncbi:ap2a1-1, partial [Symbiodinium microadriaticum]
EPATRISLADSTKLTLLVECMKPFDSAPELTLSFTEVSGGSRKQYVYPLRLPITAAAFCDPVVLDSASYMPRWKALEGEDREVQEVFASSKPVTADLVNHIRQSVVPGLKLGLANGLDSALTVNACASFRTGTPAPDGAGNIAVGAMMRLEGDAAGNRFRITVRAKHPLIAKALKNVLKAELS